MRSRTTGWQTLGDAAPSGAMLPSNVQKAAARSATPARGGAEGVVDPAGWRSLGGPQYSPDDTFSSSSDEMGRLALPADAPRPSILEGTIGSQLGIGRGLTAREGLSIRSPQFSEVSSNNARPSRSASVAPEALDGSSQGGLLRFDRTPIPGISQFDLSQDEPMIPLELKRPNKHNVRLLTLEITVKGPNQFPGTYPISTSLLVVDFLTGVLTELPFKKPNQLIGKSLPGVGLSMIPLFPGPIQKNVNGVKVYFSFDPHVLTDDGWIDDGKSGSSSVGHCAVDLGGFVQAMTLRVNVCLEAPKFPGGWIRWYGAFDVTLCGWLDPGPGFLVPSHLNGVSTALSGGDGSFWNDAGRQAFLTNQAAHGLGNALKWVSDSGPLPQAPMVPAKNDGSSVGVRIFSPPLPPEDAPVISNITLFKGFPL